MDRWLGRFAEPLYAVFRIVVGALFLQHGLQKHFGILLDPTKPAHGTAHFPSQSWFGGTIELVTGALMALGLWTGCAAFLASGTMAVAYWQFHHPRGGLPIQNGGELAVVYCFAFLYMAAKGSGVWSVDELRRRLAKPAGF
jgi:putative oxidoreductase